MTIDGDRASAVKRHGNVLEAKPLDVRSPPNGKHNEIGVNSSALIERGADAIIGVPIDAVHQGFEAQIDSTVAHIGRERQAQIAVEAASEKVRRDGLA